MRQPIQLYVLHLNPESKGMTDRYAVMRLADGGEMSPLWGDYFEPDVSGAGKKAARAWPFMVYQARPSSGPDRFPAFHFALYGYGYSKTYELASALADALGWPVELLKVTGWRSSREVAEPRKHGTRKAAMAKLEQRR